MFGEGLEEARERANVSKRQLAIAASLDRSAITHIEQGLRAPKFDKLLLLARGAKTTPAALLAGIGPQEAASARTLTVTRGRSAPPQPPSRRPAAKQRADIDPFERFAVNLRWLRQHVQPSLSQEGLALEADIDRSSPNGYETGRMAPPTLRTILKLALGLGVCPSLLMEGVELQR